MQRKRPTFAPSSTKQYNYYDEETSTFVLAFTSILPACSETITIRKEALPFSKGGHRAPAAFRIGADYENDIVCVNLKSYSGSVIVTIYDEDGNEKETVSSDITSNGAVQLYAGGLDEGRYTLRIVLGSVVYVGEFEVLSYKL